MTLSPNKYEIFCDANVWRSKTNNKINIVVLHADLNRPKESNLKLLQLVVNKGTVNNNNRKSQKITVNPEDIKAKQQEK